MQVKDMIEILRKQNPEAQVQMACTNEDGLEGNKMIDDANVFINVERGVVYVCNRPWEGQEG